MHELSIPNYLPRFFHRAKKDSLFISVGSKNLFKVTGSFTETFCGTPLYTNETFITGVSKTKHFHLILKSYHYILEQRK